MMSNQKVLITGASGYTGQHACQYFANKGYEVVPTSRTNEKYNQSFLQCELQIKEEVEKLIEKVMPDYVLHLAAQNHVGTSWIEPVSTIETNILPALYLLDSIRKYNPKCKMIIIGSILQNQPDSTVLPTHPYGLSKTIQELIAKAWETMFNSNVVMVKPSNLIGPGHCNNICATLARKIIEIEKNEAETILTVDNLYATRDFLDVRDAVRGYEILMQNGKNGVTYEMASGIKRTMEQVLEVFRSYSQADLTISYEYKDDSDQFIGNPEELMKLGWRPRISFEQSIKDILDYHRQTKG